MWKSSHHSNVNTYTQDQRHKHMAHLLKNVTTYTKIKNKHCKKYFFNKILD